MLYEVKEPFEYTTQGKDHVINSIEIGIPKGNLSVSLSVLEQEFWKAQLELATKQSAIIDSDQPKPADIEIKEKEILTMLNMGGANLEKCYIALKELVTKSNSYFNEDKNLKITAVSFEEIPSREAKNLLGWYIINFTDISV